MFWHRFFLALVAGSLAWTAAADEDVDVLSVLAGASLSYDSNLFRRADAFDPQSDIITTGYVGLRFDKPYMQQRFQLDVTETLFHYNKFSYLNFDALNYRGAWLWHLTPRVSGTLSADHSESQAPFDATLGSQRNVRTVENIVFNVDGWLFGGWHQLLGIAGSEQKSEQLFQSQPDFRSLTGEAGVRYVFPSDSSIAVIYRAIRGNYINVALVTSNTSYGDYRQDEAEVNANLILSQSSSVAGRLTWLERRNDFFTQADFSGVAGQLGYHWTPRDKVRIDFSLRRDIVPYFDLSSGSTYQVDNVLSIAPAWLVTEKVTVHMLVERGQAYYHGASGAGVTSRHDTRNNLLLGADWLPRRSVSAGATLQYLHRSSDDFFSAYDATIASLRASFRF